MWYLGTLLVGRCLFTCLYFFPCLQCPHYLLRQFWSISSSVVGSWGCGCDSFVRKFCTTLLACCRKHNKYIIWNMNHIFYCLILSWCKRRWRLRQNYPVYCDRNASLTHTIKYATAHTADVGTAIIVMTVGMIHSFVNSMRRWQSARYPTYCTQLHLFASAFCDSFIARIRISVSCVNRPVSRRISSSCWPQFFTLFPLHHSCKYSWRCSCNFILFHAINTLLCPPHCRIWCFGNLPLFHDIL